MARSLTQVGVGVFLLRRDGRVLLLKHKDDQLWRCPGGGRNQGEHPIYTAHREIYEEVGITLDERMLRQFDVDLLVHPVYGEWLTVQFFGLVPMETQGSIQEHEIHDGLAWQKLSHIISAEHESKMFEPSYRGAIKLHSMLSGIPETKSLL